MTKPENSSNRRSKVGEQSTSRKTPATGGPRLGSRARSRSLKNVANELEEAGVPVFQTAIVERAAYRDLFDFGGTLTSLDPSQTSNIEKAIDNAREFTGELVAKIKEATQ